MERWRGRGREGKVEGICYYRNVDSIEVKISMKFEVIDEWLTEKFGFITNTKRIKRVEYLQKATEVYTHNFTIVFIKGK